MMREREPAGEVVLAAGPGERPSRGEYEGRFVRLRPLDPGGDAAELYQGTHGSPERERIWAYMAYGPFTSEQALRSWLEERAALEDPLSLCVVEAAGGHRLGVVSFMAIRPESRVLELGGIWYLPEAQRTQANTESVYLMLREAFDRLGYRRVEWKCDARNAASRAAALRLGFRFEGVFRQHMVVKRRNRDTAWYALLDHEWPRVRENLERWLAAAPGSVSLAALNRWPAATTGGEAPGFCVSEAFAPRRSEPLEVLDRDGWRLKLYGIVYGERPFERAAFEEGLALAWSWLPRPARATGRPGVGFAIAHQGRGADYLVLGFWDNENELPLRVFVRRGGDAGWRPAAENESFCVWDLELLWFERQAYVETVLSRPQAPDLDAYLGRRPA